MVGTPSRTGAAKHLQAEHELSERRSCVVVGISRSTIRYVRTVKADEGKLRARIRCLAHENRRYGCLRITALLKREGLVVNKKRVHRIWKEEGLGLKSKRPKRRLYGPRGEVKRKAEGPNDVWSWDFMHDRTVNGRQFKILNVVDEFTREALVMRVGARIDSMDVIGSMKMLVGKRGMPKHIRSDNGPEFAANAVKKWLSDERCGTIYIEPGSPWENAYIESFNGKFRDECLNMNLFENGRHALEVVNEWQTEYNELRPHSSLGYETPREFAARYYSSLRATPSGTGNTDCLENPKLQVVLKQGVGQHYPIQLAPMEDELWYCQ